MKLQAASKKEIYHITMGTAAFSGILVAALYALSRCGIGTFHPGVFIGAIGGSLVAILNFTIMCLTIQNAVNIAEQKQRKAFIQGSYNGRLLLQAAWIVVAFMVSHINVIAAAVPLLFPNLTIFYLHAKDKLVTPPADETEAPEDHLDSFEI